MSFVKKELDVCELMNQFKQLKFYGSADPGLVKSLVLGLAFGKTSDEAIYHLLQSNSDIYEYCFGEEDFLKNVDDFRKRRKALEAQKLAVDLADSIRQCIFLQLLDEENFSDLSVIPPENYYSCAKSIVYAAEYLKQIERCNPQMDSEWIKPISKEYHCQQGFIFELDSILAQTLEHGRESIYFSYCSDAKKFDFSTLKNTSQESPAFPLGEVYGKYARLPLNQGDMDGGLRTKGIYKKDSEEKPLITYITVVYNRADVLPYCMESIWKQSYDNIEYIIVDGGSTDGTLELIQKFEDKIDYFVSQPDSGTYNAMNKAISLATGRFLCFMNSDDICTPDAAKIAVNTYHKTNADVISGRRKIMRVNRTIITEHGWPRYLFKNCAMVYTHMFHQSLYASCWAYEKIGYFDESYYIISDFIWESKCLNENYKVVFSEAELSIFMLGGASIKHALTMFKEWCRYIREVFPYVSEIDSEYIYYSMKLSGFGYYEITTLTRCAKKYFKYPEFKRAYYEAAMFTCIQQCGNIYKEIELNNQFSHEQKKFQDFIHPEKICGDQNINSFKSLINALDIILAQHCALEYVEVTDQKIHDLGILKHQINQYRKHLITDSNSFSMPKLKQHIRNIVTATIARSNFLTVQYIKALYKKR